MDIKIKKLVGFSVCIIDGVDRIVEYYSDKTFEIECFTGIFAETVSYINNRYGVDTIVGKRYVTMLSEAMNFDERKLGEYVTHENWMVRLAVAQYDDRFHHILKDDDDLDIIGIVARASIKTSIPTSANDASIYTDTYGCNADSDEEWARRRIRSEYLDTYVPVSKD
jgi:hypothetical protein